MWAMTSLSSLYRNYLRQVRSLPHHYLRQFFQVKASDDFRAIAATPLRKPHLRQQKIRRVSKDLRRIKLALTGRHDAFSYILDLAYGRRGKLKWELMEPLLIQPNAPPPDPIIRSVPKSRPPVYSPELKALLTNSASREKPLELHQLKFPPTLSPQARLLGPLSKRLEFNTRWRYFEREWKKVYPPLEVAVQKEKTGRANAIGFQDQGLIDHINDMVRPSAATSPMTRRERLSSNAQLPPPTQRHPSRWLRRRYQDLLGRLPILVFGTGSKAPSFNVAQPLTEGANLILSISLGLNVKTPLKLTSPSLKQKYVLPREL
ncbi:hypothetical protein BT96DRAFT_954212 [Gymnopus androsaceus JB14]|uniref:LYR motif-containing protein Cup1-like N-terminal domain-containing protein n=1 Tax=Gymnopus androsaceus JB14 TaxID=1447944 RepID=A0A6A4IEX7_9AGAR|nr:hypothetical protein BT96DRAFT_954212 [Gymnopus androsaceus JB14]